MNDSLLVQQVRKTARSPRRFGVISVAAMLAFVLYFLATFPAIQRAAVAVKYNDEASNVVWIKPENDVLCPGDTMRYSVHIDVKPSDATVVLIEGWCGEGDGCPRMFQEPITASNAFESLSFTTPAVRTVPELPPGNWEYRHRNISIFTDEHGHLKASISSYGLRVTVPEACYDD